MKILWVLGILSNSDAAVNFTAVTILQVLQRIQSAARVNSRELRLSYGRHTTNVFLTDFKGNKGPVITVTTYKVSQETSVPTASEHFKTWSRIGEEKRKDIQTICIDTTTFDNLLTSNHTSFLDLCSLVYGFPTLSAVHTHLFTWTNTRACPHTQPICQADSVQN